MRMIFVGAAANHTGDGKGRYITNPNDWIINTVRAFAAISTI